MVRWSHFLKAVPFILGLCFTGLAFGLGLGQKFALQGDLTVVYQWLWQEKGDFEDEDAGSLAFDGRLSFKPTDKDEFYLRASLAWGNGLKDLSPFMLPPNADDLEDDLKDINGRGRDHLQELWYARAFEFSGTKGRVVLGIISGSSFIDDNRFANDELAQFMNQALVNNPLANIPNYDYGLALDVEKGPFNVRFVGIGSKTPEHELSKFNEKDYLYLAAQVGLNLKTPLGEGNYRLYAFCTDRKFPDWKDERKKSLLGIGVSIDQDLIKDKLGAFLRLGYQDTRAKVDYKAMASLGIDYNFKAFGRDLGAGLGWAYLRAPSRHEELKHTEVIEAYLSIPVYQKGETSLKVSLDYQFLRDELKEGANKGHIFGLRCNLRF